MFRHPIEHSVILLPQGNGNSSWWLPLISAFAGAFFAFLFIKIGELLTKIHERKRKNYNTLVYLEHIQNENFSIAHDILFVANDIIASSEKTFSEKNLYINFNNFDSLIIKNELLPDLLNTTLINRCVSLNTHARKINHSLQGTSKMYNQINDGVYKQTLPIETYLTNLKVIVDKLNELKNFVLDYIQENKQIVAYARILMKKEKPIIKRYKFAFQNFNITDEELDKKITVLEQEIEDITRASQERIDKILKK